MNHLVFSSVVRGLLNSGSDSRYISTATAATTADILKPTEIWTELRSRNGSLFGVFYWRRMMSTSAETNLTEKDAKQAEMEAESVKTINDAVISSYWGISRPKILREDGTEWPWNCFMPWETYQSNTSIDLTKHHVPKTFLDKFAYRTVKLLRVLVCLLDSCVKLSGSLNKFIKHIAETVWLPRHDVINCGCCAWHGRRDAAALEVSTQIPAKWWLD